MHNTLKAMAISAVIAVASFGVQADSHNRTIEDVLVILSSDSLQTQGMAMVLSNTMAQQGASVSVLLCDKAGDLALKSYAAPALQPRDITPGQMLRGLLKQGGEVKVCALYLPNSEHGKEDLVDGIGVAMPPEMASQMLNGKMRTFVF